MKRMTMGSALILWLMATGLCLAQQMPSARPKPWTGIIGTEKRLTFSDYAKTQGLPLENLTAHLSAVQVLECRAIQFTALVVGAPDIVVTVAHAFQERTGGMRHPTTCGFFVTQGTKTDLYMINAYSLKTGKFRYGPIEENSPVDWAVMRLRRPVESVQPFELPEENTPIWHDDQAVFLATGPQTNFPLRDVSVRLLEDCRLRRVVDRGEGPILLKTDCDTGLGASGGAYIASLAGQRPVLLGLQSSNRGEPGCTAYDESLCFALGLPVAGDLRAAIVKMMSSDPKTDLER
jgi:hypothetical protein